MSNRDSLGFGDLIPQDVVEIFAQENSKRGRKKRSNSLGRALGWLKGKKRKGPGANGQSPGLGPALDLALDAHPAGNQSGHKGGQKSGRQAYPHGNSHAVTKRDDEKTPAPLLLQENVFIEPSRSKYLEDLHTEALEGLKLMQQEEVNNGVEYQDNESTISTMTVQTDGEGGGFMTDSTIPDSSSVVSVQSSVSTRSSRSGLTRQASTFRPLNSGKKSDRKKRKHRKTIGGIPRHVRRELGLDRVGWKLTRNLDDEQLYNGESDTSTVDEPQAAESQRGTRATRQDINFKHPLNQFRQLSDPHAGHRDDLALLHHIGPDLSDDQRPRSVAVPWMTTANSLQQEPPNPVMSMSPQAAYMSKIIPNAVLPPSIEVVEISRGRNSRNSLRTVSKSSLLLSSPAPSRASSRASSNRTTSSKASTITSASRYNPLTMSDNSCWSNSESSETLVSDSSTISSSSTPRQMRSEDGDTSKLDKVSVHSSISKASNCASNGKLTVGEVKKEGQFVRSLSVMKPKRAPPPPSRSYSLHNKMKRRSRDLAEVTVISGESSFQRISSSRKEMEKGSGSSPMHAIDSPSYHADTSSLDDSTGSGSISPLKSQLQALKAERAAMVAKTSSKDALQAKQENKKSKIVSPSSGYSSQDAISPYGSSPKHKKGILAKLQRFFPVPTSAGSAPSPEKTPIGNLKPSVDTASVSPSVRTLRDLFNIPPHPKVHAPPPPPPEVWAHSKRTFELLLGPPAPDNVYAIIKRNPKDRRQQRQSPSASTEGSVSSLVVERKHRPSAPTVESANGSVQILEKKKVQESAIVNAQSRKENNERLPQNVDFRGNTKTTERDDKVRVSDILNGMLVKAVEKREERLAAIKEEGTRTATTAVDVKTDVIPAISLSRISPSSSSSSPSAAHHLPHLLTKQTTGVASVKTVVSPESSWPPPPSPVIPVSGASVTNFPLLPPPMFGEKGLIIPVQVPLKRSMAADDSSGTNTSVVKIKSVTDGSNPPQGIAPPPLSIPPPPPYTAPPPPLKTIPPPTTGKISLPSEEAFPSPPEEFSLPPPKEFSPSPPTEVSPVKPKESSLMVQEVPCPDVKDVAPTLVTVVHPAINEVSPAPPKQISVKTAVETTLVSKLTPPSIPPPPPLPSQPQLPKKDTDLPQESIQSKSDISAVSSNSVLFPPETIPPPPPIEPLHQPQVVPLNDNSSARQEALPPEVSVHPAPETFPTPEKAQEVAPPTVIIPLAPPLPVQGFVSTSNQPCPTSSKNQSQEHTPVPNIAQKEEPIPIVTPSLLQMVKLRSIISNPETPQAQVQLQPEVPMRKNQPSNEASFSSGEAPQKPVRKSLIMTSPTSTSPPVIIVPEPAQPKSQSLVVPPASSSTALSPTKKSLVSTVSPSMNLQEAIRLRTTARSKENPASRLSLHSPTSPLDPHKSPSSTASFIFSKSNKRVVIETKSALNAKAAIQKEVKVPPPVAKKPKSTGKENDTSEGMEQTAELGGQETNMDSAEETNGTAGTVKEGKTQ